MRSIWWCIDEVWSHYPVASALLEHSVMFDAVASRQEGGATAADCRRADCRGRQSVVEERMNACVQVVVLRLQTVSSIEEKVYAAAMQKRTIADTSITGTLQNSGTWRDSMKHMHMSDCIITASAGADKDLTSLK